TRWKVGDRVIVPHAHGCGSCDFCLNGFTNVCANVSFAGTNYRGGYGEMVGVPSADRNLVALPDAVSFEAAAGLGCRFMTAWHGIVDQVAVRPGEWVFVNGCGGLGLSAIHIAKALGASVIAADISPEALSLAKAQGAMHVINSKEEDAVARVHEITGGGAHVAVDALGITVTCQAAIGSLRKRGRLLQAGLTSAAEQGYIPIPIDALVLQELSIVGVANMPIARFPDMMRMVENGVIDPQAMVSKTVGLSEAKDILQNMGSFATPGVSVLNDWK
ncbi:MAG: zinc-binding dehydrogenase, partial [Synechococcus sp.]